MIKILFLLSHVLFAAPQPSLSGTFTQACHLMDDDALISHMTIEQNLWTTTHVAYEDEKCVKPYLIYQLVYKVKQNQNDVDMTTVEAAYTSLTDTVTKSLNMINWCGFSNWKTNERKVVSGKVCDEYKAPDAGEMIYSIIDVKTNTQNHTELYLGTVSGTRDGKTSDGRFDSVDKLPFVKE